MGKIRDTVTSQVPSERLPLLCQVAPAGTTYLSQEEVVHQASAAPWQGLRRALLCLLGALFISMLAAAVVLLVTMPRLRTPLAWWQKSSFYRLPPAFFPDSNSDGHGDLEGVRQQLSKLLAWSIQALVLGPILEAGSANLTRVCPAYGSLEELRELVDEGHKTGIRILLELPAWEEELDPVAEDNRTAAGPLWGAMQFWRAQGVDGFMVGKDPAWRLDAVLKAWSELDSQTKTERGAEGVKASYAEGHTPTPPISFSVLLVWDQSQSCNVSNQVPSRVVLACHLLGAEMNLTAQALVQQVQGAMGHLRGPWPSWTVPGTSSSSPLIGDWGKILGVLLLTLPGVPLLQGGAGAPLPLDQEMLAASSNGRHPLASLYRSLLVLRAKTLALQGVNFTPLPLAPHSADVFAFFRPGSCWGVLVLLNPGSQSCQLSLRHLSLPIVQAKVLFSTHPEPQLEVSLEHVQLAPGQAILLRVPRGHGQ